MQLARVELRAKSLPPLSDSARSPRTQSPRSPLKKFHPNGGQSPGVGRNMRVVVDTVPSAGPPSPEEMEVFKCIMIREVRVRTSACSLFPRCVPLLQLEINASLLLPNLSSGVC